MRRSKVTVPWQEGLHLRPAAQLVRLAQKFRSAIRLTCNGRMADARSIVGILLLCAAARTPLDIEIVGEDEDTAIQAVEFMFRDSGDRTDVS